MRLSAAWKHVHTPHTRMQSDTLSKAEVRKVSEARREADG